MQLTIVRIAQVIEAVVSGNRDIVIKGVSSFDEATADDITFASDAKFLKTISTSGAGAIIVPDTFSIDSIQGDKSVLLQVKDPKIAFFKIVSLFHPQKKIVPGIHPTAVLGKSVEIGKSSMIQSHVTIGDHVKIGKNVQIMPGVYIGDNAVIDDHTIIKPNVTIMERSVVGRHVIIHSNTTIGSDGFGFAQADQRHEKLIHTGFVKIGDHAEIGAGNTIDRGTLGTTLIGNGVKTDNLVHIAHNVKVGDHTLLVAQVGIAGSTKIGKHVIIAGKSAVTGHITIGDNAIVGPFSGVTANVPESEIVSGIPHMPHKQWRKVVSIITRLPEMRKKLFTFEKKIKSLEEKME